MNYRPEIDGLRTIAVLSVLIYHAQFSIGDGQVLPGGFLGVDIFFVISGFLITHLITTEYRQTGKFSIANFYERRSRRLLPALLVVLLASLPFAWLLLLPTQLIDFSKSLVASLFFGSNFYWNYSLQEYGAESALLRPLLHTWSLAVEEQYYIVFPLFLMVLYKFREHYVLPVLSALLLASLIFAETVTPRDQSASFYLLPSRFWELLAGGTLAQLAHLHASKPGVPGRCMNVLGLAMVIYSISFLKFDSGHPGFVTLIPVIGTMLVLWFSNDGDMVTKVLSSRPFVGIGLISYSLYLWHYPIFAFGRIHDGTPTFSTKLVWISASFTLAVASYYLIEKPFRNRSAIALKTVITVVAICSIVLATFAAIAIGNDGLKGRFAGYLEIYGKNEFDNKVLANRAWRPLIELATAQGYKGRERPGLKPSRHEVEALWFSANPETIKALVIGNSHSRDLFNALYLNRQQFPEYEFARFGLNNRLRENEIQQLLSSPNFEKTDLIIISFKVQQYTVDALPALIERLLAAEKRVVIVSSFPGFEEIEGQPIFDWYTKRNQASNTLYAPDLNALFYEKQLMGNRDKLNLQLQELARQYSLTFLQKSKLVCDEPRKVCHGVTPSGYKSLYDSGHWTLEGAQYFGGRIHALNWLGEQLVD